MPSGATHHNEDASTAMSKTSPRKGIETALAHESYGGTKMFRARGEI